MEPPWADVHRSANVAERSPDVRSVVITGAGGMFCAGR